MASTHGHALCASDDTFIAGVPVAVQFKTSGCLFSIIASIVLTILLNLMMRSCA